MNTVGQLNDLGFHRVMVGGGCHTYQSSPVGETWEQLMLLEPETGRGDCTRVPEDEDPVVLMSFAGSDDEEGTVKGRWDTLREFLAAQA